MVLSTALFYSHTLLDSLGWLLGFSLVLSQVIEFDHLLLVKEKGMFSVFINIKSKMWY
jgi:hypothetical protein